MARVNIGNEPDVRFRINVLCRSSTTQDITKLYLTVLYSDQAYVVLKQLVKLGETSVEVHKLFSSIEEDILTLEQAARVRNLKAHIKRACPYVEIISDEDLQRMVYEFANSIEFWLEAGRSLAENFCLFAQKFDRYSELLKVSGILSGLKTNPLATCPWSNCDRLEKEDSLIEGTLLTESFESSNLQFDSERDSIKWLPDGRKTKVIIAVFPGNKVVPLTISLD